MLPFEKKKTKPIADEMQGAQARRMRPFAHVSTSNMSVPVRRRREKATARTEEFSWLMKAQQYRLSRQPKESRRREGRQAELWLMKESFLLNEIIPEGRRHQQEAIVLDFVPRRTLDLGPRSNHPKGAVDKIRRKRDFLDRKRSVASFVELLVRKSLGPFLPLCEP